MLLAMFPISASTITLVNKFTFACASVAFKGIPPPSIDAIDKYVIPSHETKKIWQKILIITASL